MEVVRNAQAPSRPDATVVIPVWNAWEHTERCLRSLEATLGPRDRVVVVDNGSSDETPDRLPAYPWVEVVTNAENRGFGPACNQGVARATGGVVIFLNNDTIVPDGWLDELLLPFAHHDVGATGPRSDNVSGPQAVPGVPDPLADPAAFAAFARAWQDEHRGSFEECFRLVGFCLAVRAPVLEAIGGFDESYAVGGYEDDDLCNRIRARDLRLVVAHGSFVHHRAHATFDANQVDWMAWEQQNRTRFVDTWGEGSFRPQILLSACLIVKDEERMLPDCLESLRDVADEVIVYDTGSTDGTVELARAAGATVIEGTWEGSFATARNAALAHATGEWVLSIDADERLQVDPKALAGQLLHPGTSIEAYLVAIENLHGPGNPRSVHTATRVFRRRRGRWRHRLHEQVVAADDPERPLEKGYLSAARLIHHGYVGDLFDERNKAERNLELARAALDDAASEGVEAHAYALMNYGRTLEAAGRGQDAVPYLARAVDLTVNPIIKRLTTINLVYVLGRLERFDEALDQVAAVRRLSRSQVAADLAEGRIRLAMGQAVEGLAILARIPTRSRDDDGMEYTPHMVAAIRGEALASLGRYADAADVVLDAIRTEGVLEADLGEVVVWLLRAERSPAEITASLMVEDLVPLLGRVLRQPAVLADLLLEGAWSRFPDRLEPLAAAGKIATDLPLTRALVWSARLRGKGLASACPLVATTKDGTADPALRLRTAAVAYGTFGDEEVVAAAREALAALDPAGHDASLAEVGRLSSGLFTVLTGAPPPAAGPAGGAPATAPAPEPAPATAPTSEPTPLAANDPATAPAAGSTTPEGGEPALARRGAVHLPEVSARPRAGGLNIVAPFEGSSLEADVARRLVVSLQQAKIPVSTTSYHRDRRDVAVGWAHVDDGDFPFDVNLLVLPPEHLTDFALDLGPAPFADRVTIGLWLWDLAMPSPCMEDGARMVQEIWTPTAQGAATVRAAQRAGPTPVHVVPLSSGRAPAGLDRSDVGLPPGPVLVTLVDYDRGFELHNPVGAVRAFSLAFTPGEGPLLVVDAAHAERYAIEHAALVDAAGGRPDIVLLDAIERSPADRDATVALADGLVSLRRADATVVTVGKAMAWGVPVVATATPSLLDLATSAPRAASAAGDLGLVPVTEGPVPTELYRYPAGATWSEPDLDEAAAALRALAARVATRPSGTDPQAHPAVRGDATAARFVRRRLDDIARRRQPAATGGRPRSLATGRAAGRAGSRASTPSGGATAARARKATRRRGR